MQTPPEIQPYGWTTADLWCAPVITGLYALLTHAQPFWADTHTVLVGLLGGSSLGKVVEPVDAEVARALCALLLGSLFAGRTAKNFGFWKPSWSVGEQDSKHGAYSIFRFVVGLWLTCVAGEKMKTQ